MKATHYVKIFLFGLAFVCVFACKTSQTTMIIGDSFDEKTNKTTLTLFPYGNIILQGKWIKTRYNENSRQHFFTNKDSTTLVVTKNPKEKYSFYKPDQNDKMFVTDFFKWDSEYWEKQGLNISTLLDSSDRGYIIWQATKTNVHDTFLFGSKNGFAYNFMATSKILSLENKIELLKEIYSNN